MENHEFERQTELTAEECFSKGYELYNSRNYSEAEEFYQKAAEQGHAVAQNNLGLCY